MAGNWWHIVALGCSSFAALSFVALLVFRKKQSCKTKPRKLPKMKLYMFDNFQTKRCKWILLELGGLYDLEKLTLDPQDKDQDTLAEYRTIQPHGTVPALEIEDWDPVIDSSAICMFLADLYGKLIPETAEERAVYYSWITYTVTTLDVTLDHLYQQWTQTDLHDQDNELIDHMVCKFQTFARYLSNQIENRDYICGDRFTTVDCVLGTSLWRASDLRYGVLLQRYPVLEDYYSRLCRRSAFQRTFA